VAEPRGLPFGHDVSSLVAAEARSLICHDGEFEMTFRRSGFVG
jgi:hypothetical protein